MATVVAMLTAFVFLVSGTSFRLVHVRIGSIRTVCAIRLRITRGWVLLRLLTVAVLRLSPDRTSEHCSAQYAENHSRGGQQGATPCITIHLASPPPKNDHISVSNCRV